MKSIRLVFLVLAFSSTSAIASPMSITFFGVINDGFDQTGVFGTPMFYLNGLTYTETVVTDPSTYGGAGGSTVSDPWVNGGSSISTPFSYYLTVNGVTFSAVISNILSNTSLFTNAINNNSIVADPHGFTPPFDALTQNGRGSTSDGQSVYFERLVQSFQRDFLNSVDYYQNISFTGPFNGESRSYFETYGAQYAVIRNSTVLSVSLNGASVPTMPPAINQVPDPGSLALVGAALLGLAATRRRQLANTTV